MKSWYEFLFPVTVLAFIGTSVVYLSMFFSSNMRWVFLLALAAQQLFLKYRRNYCPTFMVCLFLYTLWGITTTFWSYSFELSILKSFIFFILAFTMISAGQYWVAHNGIEKSFDWLVPLTVIAFVAAILGYFFYSGAFDGNLYQGLVRNSNMFGVLMAMTIPYLVWNCYLNRSNRRTRIFWTISLLIAIYFIYLSVSRAAFLLTLLSLLGGIVSMKMNKLIISFVLIIGFLTLAYALIPDTGTQVVHRLLYKNSDTITDTRIQAWEDSLQNATLGEWFGAGYGVSIGAGSFAMSGYNTVGYGREKGNSQLAIIEETGVVGFVLYLLVLGSLFERLISRYVRTKNDRKKVALGLYIGALIGMVVHSCFEAWWVAPGAPESAVFWALAGCALGVASMDTNTPPLLNERGHKGN